MDFKYPKHFSPFPTDHSKQEWYFFKKGDVLPADVAEHCSRFSNYYVREWTDEKILEEKTKVHLERGLSREKAEEKAKEEMGQREEPKSATKPILNTREDLERVYGKGKVDALYKLKKKEQLAKLSELTTLDVSDFNETERITKILELTK